MNTASHPDSDALNAWVDQELLDTERADLAAHLAACARCRQEVEELHGVKAALAALPQAEPPHSFQLTREQAAAARPAVTARSVVHLLPIVRALSVAAVLTLLVVSGALWFGPVREPDSTSNASLASETSAAPEASMRQEAAAAGGGAAEAADEEQTAPTQETLGAMAPAAGAAAAPEPASDPRSTLPAASDEEGTSTLAIAAIGLGVLSVVLLGLWFMLARAEPAAGSRR